jgi:hypothetical protein
MGTMWNGEPMQITQNASSNAGESFKSEQNVLLYGSYYFMAGNIHQHEYQAFNIINLASHIGGLSKLLMAGFSVFAIAINDRIIKAKLIRSLYFILKPK